MDKDKEPKLDKDNVPVQTPKPKIIERTIEVHHHHHHYPPKKKDKGWFDDWIFIPGEW